MRILKSIFVGAILLSVTVASSLGGTTAAAPVAPAKTEPQSVRWKDQVVRLAISSSLTQPNSNIKASSDVMGAIRRSIQTWQTVTGIEYQVEMSDRQSASPPGASGDGVSLITIAGSPENVLLFSKNPLTESAKTRVFYNRKGFITEADIVLNPFQQFSTDGTFGTFDLESTLTHEIGHLLGLRHSAVLGSTMSDTLSKNGIFGNTDFGARTLADCDISAIRELYGNTGTGDDCCAVIAGKLNIPLSRSSKGFRVWAEENRTGRVVAQVDTAADGSFRLGGLPGGTFLVFWQKRDDPAETQIGELGLVRLEVGETKTLNEKVTIRRSDMALRFVGINSQLTDSAVALSPGREYIIYVGGKNLDPASLNFEFNSPFFTVSEPSATPQDFGDGISVISFVLTVKSDTLAGAYSIFTIAGDGSRSSMIGAINIE